MKYKLKKNDLIVNILGLSSLLSVILLWNYNIILTITLLIIGLIMLKILNKFENYITFIVCGIFGASAEILAVYYSVWTYNNSSYLGIPIWLVPLWALASIFMNNLTKQIKEIILLNKK